jgi:hypothetical protein
LHKNIISTAESMSSILKTIKPLTLDGLRSLLNAGFDPNTLDLVDDNLENILSDENLVQDLLALGWKCEHDLVLKLLQNTSSEKAETIAKNLHSILLNNPDLKFDCSYRPNIIPKTDLDWNCRYTYMDNKDKPEKKNLVDDFLESCDYGEITIDCTQLEDMILEAMSHGFEIQPSTLAYLAVACKNFNHWVLNAKHKELISDMEYFYIVFQYASRQNSVDEQTFFELVSEIDVAQIAEQLSTENFVQILSRLKNNDAPEFAIDYLYSHNFKKTNPKDEIWRIPSSFSSESREHYEKFGLILTIVDDVDYDAD